jgi:glucose-1-phosphate thymidylyltransferase
MKVLILAAGYAVRLQPLTLNTPKPLLPVGKRAILDRIIDRVEKLKNVEAVYVVTNEKFFGKFEEWKQSSSRNFEIKIINDGTTSDENKLGAIGDMLMFAEKAGDEGEILVIAGDNIFEFDLGDFLDFGRSKDRGISIALHDVKRTDLAQRYGVVEIDETGKVVGFSEKPKEPKTTLISTCVYYFPNGKFRFLREYVKEGRHQMDAPGNFIRWAKDNAAVYGYVFEESWYDIGGIESYREADQKYT